MMKEDIRDIKGIISIFDWGSFFFLLAIILFSVLLGYFIYRRLKKRRLTSRITAEKEVIERPFDEVALEELEALDPFLYFERMMFKEYYLLTTAIVRRFLAKNYIVDTFDKTSLEIITAVETKERNYEKVRMLDNYFQGCDLVKFAKYKPSLAEMRENRDESLRMVKELSREKGAMQGAGG